MRGYVVALLARAKCAVPVARKKRAVCGGMSLRFWCAKCAVLVARQKRSVCGDRKGVLLAFIGSFCV